MLILTTQIASEMDSEQRKELEHMILELEAENANLKDEYNHLKTVGVGQITLGECTLNDLVYPIVPVSPPSVQALGSRSQGPIPTLRCWQKQPCLGNIGIDLKTGWLVTS